MDVAAFIAVNHKFLATTCRIITDPALTTRGEVVDPVGRYAPTELRPWTEFVNLRRDILQKLAESLSESLPNPLPAGLDDEADDDNGNDNGNNLGFPATHQLLVLGRYYRRELDSEQSTTIHNSVALWQPVQRVLDRFFAYGHQRPDLLHALGIHVDVDSVAEADAHVSEQGYEEEAESPPTVRFQNHRNLDPGYAQTRYHTP